MQFQRSLTRTVAASALTLVLSFPATALRAQSVPEGLKMLQYERYESAKRILTPLAATDPRASYYLGLAELGLENTAAAQAAFTKYPDDAASLAGQAQVAYINGNKAEGDRLAAAAADKAKKKDWEPLRFAADAYYRGGEYQRAVDLYNKALERGADNSTRVALGDAYLKLPGGGGQSMTSFEKVTGADAKNSLAYSRIGSVWYSAKRYDLALENYNKAKESDPENPLPYRDLANAYFYTGKYENARKNIEEYLKYSDKTADDEIQYLNILYLGKDYPAAIQKANELIQSGARRPGLYGILAYSQIETKDSVNALTNARTYLSMQKPERIFPSDYLNMGRIFLLNSMSDSAAHYFDLAIAKDTAKNKADVYRGIAEAFKDRKGSANYKAAGKYYGLAAQQPGGSANDYYYWGFYSYYGGDIATAQTAFDAMEQKHPGTPQAAFWRGRLAAAKDEEGKTGAATPFFESWLAMPDEKAKRSNRDLSIAYQYLALVAYNKGDKATTEQYLSKITAIEPENSFVKQIRAAQAGGTKKK